MRQLLPPRVDKWVRVQRVRPVIDYSNDGTGTVVVVDRIVVNVGNRALVDAADAASALDDNCLYAMVSIEVFDHPHPWQQQLLRQHVFYCLDDYLPLDVADVPYCYHYY